MDRNRSSVKRQRIFLFQASSLIIDEESTIQYKCKDAEKDKNYPKGCAREQQLNIDNLSKVDKSNLCGQCWMAFEARVIKQSHKMVKKIAPKFSRTCHPDMIHLEMNSGQLVIKVSLISLSALCPEDVLVTKPRDTYRHGNQCGDYRGVNDSEFQGLRTCPPPAAAAIRKHCTSLKNSVAGHCQHHTYCTKQCSVSRYGKIYGGFCNSVTM